MSAKTPYSTLFCLGSALYKKSKIRQTQCDKKYEEENGSSDTAIDEHYRFASCFIDLDHEK